MLGGIPTFLNYYEEVTFECQLNGCSGPNTGQEFNIRVVRCGNEVILQFLDKWDVSGIVVNRSGLPLEPYITADPFGFQPLPERFRPSVDMIFPFVDKFAASIDTVNQPVMTVRSDNSTFTLQIYRTAAKTFYTPGTTFRAGAQSFRWHTN